jgi:hypothetical protein
MNISDILSAIESKCLFVKNDATSLADFVARLPMQRNFTTKAEAAMDEAEAALIEALKLVRTSRTSFQNKPKELTHENRESI